MTNYFGIFDGHAGHEAAVYSASHLHQYLVESANYPHNPESALRDAFLKTDEKFREKDSVSGTTAVCTLLMNDTLYVAWAGDSQAVLARTNDRFVSLVNPHVASRDVRFMVFMVLFVTIIEVLNDRIKRWNLLKFKRKIVT